MLSRKTKDVIIQTYLAESLAILKEMDGRYILSEPYSDDLAFDSEDEMIEAMIIDILHWFEVEV